MTMTKCPYCNVSEDRESIQRHDKGISSSLFQCRCGAFFHVFLADPTVAALSMSGVYFVECAGFIKIGHSTDWAWRRRVFEAATPLPLTVIGVVPTSPEAIHHARLTERALHVRFQHLRHRFEWFRGEPELRDWIAKHAHLPGPYLRESDAAPERTE